MFAYLIRRLLAVIPVMAVVVTVVFMLIHLIPGDPVSVMRGDLGQSYFLDRPVVTAIVERAEPTLMLMACALLVAVVIGVPSGIVAAAHRGSIWDRVLMIGSLLGVCVPGFWLSLNFIYLFAVRLGWLPAAGYASLFTEPATALRYMVLPAVSLGFNQ